MQEGEQKKNEKGAALLGRTALFISHGAIPQDSAFTRWLGAKLAGLGYEVWADVMKLHGGDDWSRELENALRQRARKLLVVCSPEGLDRQGVRNEIEIGTTLAKQLGDANFIVPLRLRPYESPFLIAHLQYVDFSTSWAAGLAELSELLENVYKVPRPHRAPLQNWKTSQAEGATQLVEAHEPLASNWLSFQSVPTALFYCEPPTGFPLDAFQRRNAHKWPMVPVAGGALTFSETDADGYLGQGIPAKRVALIRLEEYLSNGWPRLGLSPQDARRHFSDLGNQAFERFLSERGLASYQASPKALKAWFGGLRAVPHTKISFAWAQKGSRQIIGQSAVRKIHWHYAVSAQVRTWPIQHLRLYPKLIFSENGVDPIDNAGRMHRLRRSFAKSWRNARWRDMLSAFLWWLSGGQAAIKLSVSENHLLVLDLPPLAFQSSISVMHAGEAPPDDDDPDIGDEDYGDDLEDDADRQVEESA